MTKFQLSGDSDGQASLKDRKALKLATLVALALVFAVDTVVPLGTNIGALYLPIVLAALMSRSTAFLAGCTAAAITLMGLGALLSPPAYPGLPAFVPWTNRLFSVVMILITSGLGLKMLGLLDRLRANGERLTQNQRALEEKHHLLQVASDVGNVGGWSVSVPEYRVTWSDEVAQIHGMPNGFSPPLDDAIDFYAPEFRSRISEVFNACVTEGVPFDEELQIIASDGRRVWVRSIGRAVREVDGSIIEVQGAFQDISDRKAAEAKIARLNRVHALLSQINSTIVHTRDRQALFDAACRIAVDVGGFRAAWIGIADGKTHAVNTAAAKGEIQGYLEEIRIVTDLLDENGRGPFGTAFRGNRYVVCNDTENDPDFAPWREPALARDYRAVAVFPLRLGQATFGAYVLYSDVKGFFDAEEIKLLEEVADDISFAVEFIAQEARRREAEDFVRESEERFRAVFNHAAVGIYIVSPEYRFLRVNERFSQIIGYSADELVGTQKSNALTYGPDQAKNDEAWKAVLAGEASRTLEKRYVRKDGSPGWVRLTLSAIRTASGAVSAFIGVVVDISEQRDAEDRLRRNQNLLTMASRTSRLGAWEVNLIDDVVTWSDELCLIAGVPQGYAPTLSEAIGFYVMEGQDLLSKAFAACAQHGVPYDIELEFVTADGRTLQTRSIGEAVRDEAGRIVRVQGGFQDVSSIKQAEAALIDSLRRFEDLANTMPMIVWTAQPDGAVDFLTQAFDSFTGMTKAQGNADDWINVVHPEDHRRSVDAWEASFKTGTPYSVELRIRRYDGEHRWHIARAVPVRDSSGVIKKWYGSAIEIHDLKLAEEKARALAERLEITFESITDAFFTLDPYWRFTYVNREAERLLQREGAALIGKDVWIEFAAAVGSTFDRQYHLAVEENRTVRFEEFYAPLDLWLEVHAYPSKEGLAVYFRDITQRRLNEAQLRLLETSVSQLNDIVLITEAEPVDDPGPRIVFVNDAFERRTGYTRAEVLGKSPRILQGPGTERSELDRIRAALEKWQPVRAELLNYTKSGEEFWLELNIVPVADEKGWYTHWVSVERDVTERHKLEGQLRQAQRMESVGQLTGGVAHDFNNLLTVILGNAELLSEELAANARLSPLAQLIVEAAGRGAELTQRLLAFARRQPLAPVAVDVNGLIGGMDALLRRTLGEHVEIGFVRGAGLWPSLVDPAQLESALLNLCINSRDAMPEGGHLTIETSNAQLDEDYTAQYVDVQPGEYVLVAVSDTGCGIAAEDLSRVFEPFYTTKPKGKGTGLGLSMVYGFVKQSRGHVSIYSEPGKGTTMKLYLPRTSMDGEAAEVRPAAANRGGTETILLVEDEELVRRYASEQLRLLGYTVIEAGNGAEALKILEQHGTIDLLFTDVVMPGMSGRELADAAQRLRPGLKVLYTSGYTENAIVHHGRLDPGVHLLSKPYRRAELADSIRTAIQAGREK